MFTMLESRYATNVPIATHKKQTHLRGSRWPFVSVIASTRVLQLIPPTLVGGPLISTYVLCSKNSSSSEANATNFSWWSFSFTLREPALNSFLQYHQLQLVVL